MVGFYLFCSRRAYMQSRNSGIPSTAGELIQGQGIKVRDRISNSLIEYRLN
jgi:hypothetical protein